MHLKRFTSFDLNEGDKFAKVKGGVLHIDLIGKYGQDGTDKTIEEGFAKFKEKIEDFTDRNEKHDLKIGDIIEFTGGYNSDIRFTTSILGFDSDSAYVFWDCFWFPIKLEDRSLKVIKRV